MNAEQCRNEVATVQELDPRADGSTGLELNTQMLVSTAQALWEIAAQLAELNGNIDGLRSEVSEYADQLRRK